MSQPIDKPKNKESKFYGWGNSDIVKLGNSRRYYLTQQYRIYSTKRRGSEGNKGNLWKGNR